MYYCKCKLNCELLYLPSLQILYDWILKKYVTI